MTVFTKSISRLRLPLSRQMLIGASIGMTLILLYLLTVKEPDPEWGKYWMIKPILIVSFAGAMGGMCNYVIINFRSLLGLSKSKAVIASLFFCAIGLIIGFALGLNGTLWN